jgi:hypothetical protein
LNALLTVDFLAKRYGYLPSKILESGTTMDLFVAETAVGYENWLAKNPKQGSTLGSDYSTEQLQNMINAVRSKGATDEG